MTDVQKQVASFCEQHRLLSHGATVVVAVSGGPDSLCLLHVLRGLVTPWQLQLHVAHLDHQLRPEASDDAAFVAAIAAQWQLPVTVRSADVGAISQATHRGIEVTAREVRSRFLLDTARCVGAQAIALGHTADDQAETVLLRLLRGAGPTGLAAIRPKRPADDRTPGNHGIALVRPLLSTTRPEVEAHCITHQLPARHDPSNELPIYTRNSVRGYILPLLKTYNPSIVATLGRTARVCAEEDDLLNELVLDIWSKLATVDAGSVTLQRQGFEQLHPALKRRVLRRAAARVDAAVELEARHIDLAVAAVAEGRRRLQLPHNLWLVITQAEVQLTSVV